MIRMIYEVVLLTPLGKRKGMLEIRNIEDNLIGYLDLLGKRDIFIGKTDENGMCHMKGELVTLMSRMDCSMEGSLKDREIRMELQCRKRTYLMHGTKIREQEVNEEWISIMDQMD